MYRTKRLSTGSWVTIVATLLAIFMGCDTLTDSESDSEVEPGPDSNPETEIELVGYEGDIAFRNDAIRFLLDLGDDEAVFDTTFDTLQDAVDYVAADTTRIGFVFLPEFDGLNVTGLTKAPIDGVNATIADVHAEDYPMRYDLFLTYLDPQTDFAQDFVEYAQSSAGQTYVTSDVFIGLATPGPDYTATALVGTYTVGGSATVAGFADDMIEGYEAERGDDIIDGPYISVGSGAGADNTVDGTYDLAGMSRDLNSGEVDAGLENVQIGYQAIAIIVNDDAPAVEFTLAEISGIVADSIEIWEDVGD